MNLGPERARCEFFLREQRTWHDDIRVHKVKRQLEFLGYLGAPQLPDAHRIFITDHQRRSDFRNQRRYQVPWTSDSDNERNIAGHQIRLGVDQAIDEELVVPPLGLRVVGSQTENRHHGLSQRVTQRDCHVERGIVDSPLRPLHPVNDALPLAIGCAGTQHTNTRMRSQQPGECSFVQNDLDGPGPDCEPRLPFTTPCSAGRTLMVSCPL